MAEHGKQRKKRDTTARNSLTWSSLTWEDLDRWAGSRSVSRGRTYHRGGRVKDLVISADGKLLATVTGGRRYATSVWLEPSATRSDALGSLCTCPIGSRCKHAVAVVAAYLQVLANDEAVPLADDADPRWAKLAAASEEADDEPLDDDFSFSDDDEDQEQFPEEDADEAALARPRRRRTAAPKSSSRSQWDRKIEQHVRAKSRAELADLVCTLVKRFPELRTEFQERIALAEGDVERLVAQARKEVKQVTAEVGWHNSWSGEGHIPDYDRLKQRLVRLVEMGHGDRVVELGRELIRRGFAQIGESHDEGETGMAFAECLPAIFGAVAKSSLTPCEKILFAIDASLEDDYGIINEEADAILEAEWQPADWSAVADALAKRLKAMPGGQDQEWSRNYRRNHISGWLLDALSSAGRESELLGIYEAEARATGSYERLVRYLIEQNRIDDAERWAREGIEQTKAKLPGIADNLAKMLVEVAARRKEWTTVAAHAACRFFEHPGVSSFKELLKAARKAECEDAVQKWAQRHLETGAVPWRTKKTKTGPGCVTVDPDWPLPLPDFLIPLLRLDAPYRGPGGPHFGVLLEMAIAEKRPDDVLHWYDKLGGDKDSKTRGGLGWAESSSYGDQVAAAVAKSHPERTLAIYRRRLEGHLHRADVSAYESAANYLRQMRPILKTLGREAEWTKLLADIRQNYKNRPKFMEILERLEGRPIVQSNQARRRR